MMKRYILTGTPGAGKTSILNELKNRGYCVIEEAATDVIAFERMEGNTEPHTRSDFIDKIIKLQKQRQLQADTLPYEVQFYDRSPVCTYSLSRYLGYESSPSLIEELHKIARDDIYETKVFFIENLGFCEPTDARKISFEESLVFERVHVETYQSLGYDLVKIAPASISERVENILKNL